MSGRPAIRPQSLADAYLLLKSSRTWELLDAKTRSNYARTLENHILPFPFGKKTLGEARCADIRRRDFKKLFDRFHQRGIGPVVALMVRKLIVIALDEGWRADDPTQKLKVEYRVRGHPTWTRDHMEKFEKRWPVGTRQRVAYDLALWLGIRVSDIVRLDWDQHYRVRDISAEGRIIEIAGFEFVPWKGSRSAWAKGEPKVLFIPVSPPLAGSLAHLQRAGLVLQSERKAGYSSSGLSSMMRRWSEMAGIEPGFGCHGLRKALGVRLAEADATTRQ